MNNNQKHIAYLPGFILWIIAQFVLTDPEISYWFSWSSSFFIFYWTIFSKFRFINDDIPTTEQILRPIFIIQIIFAGFMCCTSIFYFFDHLGYRYFEKVNPSIDIPNAETYLIAECQRLSLLAHASLVAGIILLINKKEKNKRKYFIGNEIDINNFLGLFSLFIFAAGVVFKLVPGFTQFSGGLITLSVFSGSFVLVKGIVQQKKKLVYIGGGLFLSNFLQASLSGFKEPILMSVIILGCLLFPVYKKLTIFVGLPLLYGLLYILPTYVGIIRAQTWSGEQSAQESRSVAFDTLLNEENAEDIKDTNWAFLIDRISEIGMFTKFVDNTPRVIDYYGTDIIVGSLYALIPRVLWAQKPVTEQVSMERVYAAGVISETSIVSAKTRPVVDAYLSYGTIGVFVFFILIGLIAQFLSNSCENRFGGYQFGTMIIMGTFSDTLWRGNNFEFMFNSLFYGYILVLIIHGVLKIFKILIPFEFPVCQNQEIFIDKLDNSSQH
ncbi:MAG: hypothetical protein EAZ51_07950 [Sphingobacteriales bacterium]|nr:MAG: hypothetical protein EAZ51_07950 [Sphingobacteriales bacterium]